MTNQACNNASAVPAMAQLRLMANASADASAELEPGPALPAVEPTTEATFSAPGRTSSLVILTACYNNTAVFCTLGTYVPIGSE
eukprot:COSAG06_NODE_374_length_16681_cov_41.526836_12_plen_84_part_00